MTEDNNSTTKELETLKTDKRKTDSSFRFAVKSLLAIILILVVTVCAVVLTVGPDRLGEALNIRFYRFLVDKSINEQYGVTADIEYDSVRHYNELTPEEKEIFLPSSTGGSIYYYKLSLSGSTDSESRTDGFTAFLVDNGDSLICYDDLWCRNYDDSVTEYLEQEISQILDCSVNPLSKSYFSKFFTSPELETRSDIQTLQSYYVFGDAVSSNPDMLEDTGAGNRVLHFNGTYTIEKEFSNQDEFRYYIGKHKSDFKEKGLFGTFTFVPSNYKSDTTNGNDWSYTLTVDERG